MARRAQELPTEGRVLGASDLILVTLGSSMFFPFARLVKHVENLSDQFADQILFQSGCRENKIQSTRVKCTGYVSVGEFDRICGEADLVISQAGVGVMISCLSKGTPLILIPRLARLGETTTQHQSEMYNIVHALELEREVAVLEEEGDFIELCKNMYGKRYTPLSVGNLPRALCSFMKMHEASSSPSRNLHHEIRSSGVPPGH